MSSSRLGPPLPTRGSGVGAPVGIDYEPGLLCDASRRAPAEVTSARARAQHRCRTSPRRTYDWAWRFMWRRSGAGPHTTRERVLWVGRGQARFLSALGAPLRDHCPQHTPLPPPMHTTRGSPPESTGLAQCLPPQRPILERGSSSSKTRLRLQLARWLTVRSWCELWARPSFGRRGTSQGPASPPQEAQRTRPESLNEETFALLARACGASGSAARVRMRTCAHAPAHAHAPAASATSAGPRAQRRGSACHTNSRQLALQSTRAMKPNRRQSVARSQPAPWRAVRRSG